MTKWLPLFSALILDCIPLIEMKCKCACAPARSPYHSIEDLFWHNHSTTDVSAYLTLAVASNSFQQQCFAFSFIRLFFFVIFCCCYFSMVATTLLHTFSLQNLIRFYHNKIFSKNKIHKFQLAILIKRDFFPAVAKANKTKTDFFFRYTEMCSDGRTSFYISSGFTHKT